MNSWKKLYFSAFLKIFDIKHPSSKWIPDDEGWPYHHDKVLFLSLSGQQIATFTNQPAHQDS